MKRNLAIKCPEGDGCFITCDGQELKWFEFSEFSFEEKQRINKLFKRRDKIIRILEII